MIIYFQLFYPGQIIGHCSGYYSLLDDVFRQDYFNFRAHKWQQPLLAEPDFRLVFNGQRAVLGQKEQHLPAVFSRFVCAEEKNNSHEQKLQTFCFEEMPSPLNSTRFGRRYRSLKIKDFDDFTGEQWQILTESVRRELFGSLKESSNMKQ